MGTGGGNIRLDRVLTTIGVPGMKKKMFIKTEQLLGEAINKQLVHFMATAGCEKKDIAIVSNHYHQGVPYISVVVDGGWSKCSHKHSL